ncbi:MAG: AbrB/MazE/SpoVT family DNA-binding domain-containing protein [Methylococcaceae bacterium]|nr:MAG: AbrB/MazE/SpoVT family DNA-binding domain-containing protein [Methylococcaceae bacterium]
METTVLSNTGHIVIPKSVRELHHWSTGTEFAVVDTPQGVLLKPKKTFPETTLEGGLGCVEYKGPPLAAETIENLLEEDIRRAWSEK